MLGINFLVVMIIVALVVPILVVVLFSRHDAKIKKEAREKKERDEREKYREEKFRESRQKETEKLQRQAEEDAFWTAEKIASKIKETLEKFEIPDLLVHAVALQPYEQKIPLTTQPLFLSELAAKMIIAERNEEKNSFPTTPTHLPNIILIYNENKSLKLGDILFKDCFSNLHASPDFRSWLIYRFTLAACWYKNPDKLIESVLKVPQILEKGGHISKEDEELIIFYKELQREWLQIH
ncbi:MAG TPA: hypothetical protein PLB38_01060 [bacterium]|nr:hypothetical protein [bacterium]